MSSIKNSATLALVGLLVSVAACNNDLTTPTRPAGSELTRLGSRSSLRDAIGPQIAAGGEHSCALRTDGTVICWGNDAQGQSSVPADLGVVTQIAAGEYHTCAIRANATVVCWGDNSSGQARAPDGLTSVSQVDAGSRHTCAVQSDGIVVCWGAGYYGEEDVPIGLSSVAQVAAGDNQTCALQTDRTVTCWGFYTNMVPADLSSVTQISAGSNLTCAVKTDGSGVCWGLLAESRGLFGGTGDLRSSVAQLEAGRNTVCFLTTDARIFCSDYDDYFGIWSPAAELQGFSAVLQIALGGYHGCAVKTDGTVACWGSDRYGQSSVPPGLNLIVSVPNEDTEPPVIEAVANVFAEASSAAGAIVTFPLPTATDVVGVISVECSAASGSWFPLGSTTVFCTALDAAGNAATTAFTITVLDQTAPTLTVPADITVDATSSAGAVVSYSTDATDAVGPLGGVTCTTPSGSVFATGVTTVTCSVSDESGNTATDAFTVTVKGAAAQVSDLQTAVTGLELQEGTETSVQAKLSNALAAIASGDNTSACGSLNALINQVNAQTGKKITEAQAAELIAHVRRVTATVGC